MKSQGLAICTVLAVVLVSMPSVEAAGSRWAERTWERQYRELSRKDRLAIHNQTRAYNGQLVGSRWSFLMLAERLRVHWDKTDDELWQEAEEACRELCGGDVDSPNALAVKQELFEAGKRVRESSRARYREHIQRMLYDHTGEYRLQQNKENKRSAKASLERWELIRKEYGFEEPPPSIYWEQHRDE